MPATYPQRQVHLDFHTSPFIPDVGSEFDAAEFAATLKRAHVNSVTIFAKCHHGRCYYPTSVGVQHPALKERDLLGEQIEALHREGIRCPIYTTIVWEEDAAQKHPEWRQLRKDGLFAGWNCGPEGQHGLVGLWKFLNFLEPDYQDYIEAHLREIFARYGNAVDGIFHDILFFDPKACWSDASVRFREKQGVLADNAATFDRFQGLAQKSFTEKFSKIIRGLKPDASIFYNAGNEGNMDPGVGPRARAEAMTHFEIESLPSGAWGYYHFPRMARMQSHWGKYWMGMTGRFQKAWGDFGGIKPQAALEYECFRSQALGGGNSVGDQLPPRGKLDPAAYHLIGAVFAQCADAEPFYEGSTPLAQVGILSASFPGVEGGKSEEGAVQMCEESHYDAAVLDALSDLFGLELVILPDSTAISPATKSKLQAFYEQGGKLIISHRGGFDAEGRWALDFLPLTFHGEVEQFPTYWRCRPEFSQEMSASDRAFYQPGLNVQPGKGAAVLVDRVLPYFQRTDVRFCSHLQTPPIVRADSFPAVVAGDRFVYFADPIFREYRQSGNITARDAWRLAMHRLIGDPPFGAGLPSTVQIYPRRKGKDLLLTLLHYVPMRKAIDIDVIEERHSFAGETLRLPQEARAVRVYQGEELSSETPGSFQLPMTKGRILLNVVDYFGSTQSPVGTRKDR